MTRHRMGMGSYAYSLSVRGILNLLIGGVITTYLYV